MGAAAAVVDELSSDAPLEPLLQAATTRASAATSPRAPTVARRRRSGNLLIDLLPLRRCPWPSPSSPPGGVGRRPGGPRRARTASSGAACTAHSASWQAVRSPSASVAASASASARVASASAPAGEQGDLGGQLGVGRGLEPGRVAVVPAAELAPHVAHHELGLVVDRPQVRAIEQVVGDLHRVDDRVEGGALVHEVEGGGDEALRGPSAVVVEHPLDAIDAADGQAVGGSRSSGRGRRSRAAPGPSPHG